MTFSILHFFKYILFASLEIKMKKSISFQLISDVSVLITSNPPSHVKIVVEAIREICPDVSVMQTKNRCVIDLNVYDEIKDDIKGLEPEYSISLIPSYVKDFSNTSLAAKPYCRAYKPLCYDKLFEYQKEGFKRGIQQNGRIFLADEMGLGKSIQSIAILDYFKKWTEIKSIVICPSILKENWKREIIKWTNISENEIQTIFKVKEVISRKKSIFIIAYDLFVRREIDFRKLGINFAIVDEVHYLKNRKSKRAKKIAPFLSKMKYLVLLSGTPATSRVDELFIPLNILEPKIFPLYFPFSKRYCEGKKGRFGWESLGKSNTEEMNYIFNKMAVRRLKKDVLQDLPSKIRESLFVEIPPSKKKIMEDLFEELREMNNELRRNQSKTKYTSELFFKRNAKISELYRASADAKKKGVFEVISNELECGSQKFIVFSHHMIILDGIEECIKKYTSKNTKLCKWVRIDGKTPQNQRQRKIDTFLSDPSMRVAILGLQACNAGLNIAGVNKMIFAELSWNPSTLIQAEDRIHRIGATGNAVMYSYILAKNTYDEKLYEMLQLKFKNLSKTIDLNHNNLDGFSTHTTQNLETTFEDDEDATLVQTLVTDFNETIENEPPPKKLKFI